MAFFSSAEMTFGARKNLKFPQIFGDKHTAYLANRIWLIFLLKRICLSSKQFSSNRRDFCIEEDVIFRTAFSPRGSIIFLHPPIKCNAALKICWKKFPMNRANQIMEKNARMFIVLNNFDPVPNFCSTRSKANPFFFFMKIPILSIYCFFNGSTTFYFFSSFYKVEKFFVGTSFVLSLQSTLSVYIWASVVELIQRVLQALGPGSNLCFVINFMFLLEFVKKFHSTMSTRKKFWSARYGFQSQSFPKIPALLLRFWETIICYYFPSIELSGRKIFNWVKKFFFLYKMSDLLMSCALHVPGVTAVMQTAGSPSEFLRNQTLCFRKRLYNVGWSTSKNITFIRYLLRVHQGFFWKTSSFYFTKCLVSFFVPKCKNSNFFKTWKETTKNNFDHLTMFDFPKIYL